MPFDPVPSDANAGRALATVGRLILAILIFGITGTLIELTLLAHYEDVKQLIPLGLLAFALVALVLQLAVPRQWTILAFQSIMVLFIMAGFLGVFYHYEGSKEFQLETDASLSGMNLFWKVLQAKAPPTLAPGLMVQLGILGLVYAFTRKPRN
jgi:hypothetical protein